jgi:hypothetical protein
MAFALLVKLVPGCELELPIGAGQRGLEAGMEEIAGFDHDHAGGAAIRTAVIQPEQGHKHNCSEEVRLAGGACVSVRQRMWL